MAIFHYTARDKETRRQVTGTVEAVDKLSAINQIERMQLFPVKVHIPAVQAPSKPSFSLFQIIALVAISVTFILGWFIFGRNLRVSDAEKTSPLTGARSAPDSSTPKMPSDTVTVPDMSAPEPSAEHMTASSRSEQRVAAPVRTEVATPRERTIRGEVFVVTRGRENLKLALVDILAIPTAALNDHLEAKQIDVKNQTVRVNYDLKQKDLAIEDAQNARNRAKEAGLEALEKKKNILLKRDELLQRVRRADVTDSSEVANLKRQAEMFVAENNALNGTIKQLKDEFEKCLPKVEEAIAQRVSVQDELAFLSSAAPLFKDLPEPSVIARSDSDGRFSMAIPTDNSFTLVAQTSREIFGSTETYYWIVPLTDDLATVVLSNNNMLR